MPPKIKVAMSNIVTFHLQSAGKGSIEYVYCIIKTTNPTFLKVFIQK